MEGTAVQGSRTGRTRGGLATRARFPPVGLFGDEEEGEEWSSTHGSRTNRGMREEDKEQEEEEEEEVKG